MKVYHGSNVQVEKPRILTNGFYKDFGYGFYCTRLEKQAVKWALAKKNTHILNSYDYTMNDKLHILSFAEMSEEWLDFVAECRNGGEHHYDIVEGPMADDQVWDYVEDYLAGEIRREAFWELVKFKHPTHQIVFCTEDSLETISFMEARVL